MFVRRLTDVISSCAVRTETSLPGSASTVLIHEDSLCTPHQSDIGFAGDVSRLLRQRLRCCWSRGPTLRTLPRPFDLTALIPRSVCGTQSSAIHWRRSRFSDNGRIEQFGVARGCWSRFRFLCSKGQSTRRTPRTQRRSDRVVSSCPLRPLRSFVTGPCYTVLETA